MAQARQDASYRRLARASARVGAQVDSRVHIQGEGTSVVGTPLSRQRYAQKLAHNSSRLKSQDHPRI
ncbi:hypothetical protein [Roseibium album]|uniref:hypothetical protein n=1 Tax=Roseibium album TaxID=311410 RepID=UPI0024921D2B|nr:hypothetical protein [Roseibium album]